MMTVRLTRGLLAVILLVAPSLRAQESDTTAPLVSDASQKGTLTLGVQGDATEASKQVSVSVSPN